MVGGRKDDFAFLCVSLLVALGAIAARHEHKLKEDTKETSNKSIEKQHNIVFYAL